MEPKHNNNNNRNSLEVFDHHEDHHQEQHRNLMTTGTMSVLVIQALINGDGMNEDESYISNEIFGTSGDKHNLKS